jgi:hypothetical protein
MSTARIVVNVAAFQAVWLATVGGAATGRAWLGPVATVALLVGHLASAVRPLREIAGLVAIGVVGLAWDSLLVALGLIEYRAAAVLPYGAPVWIGALWVAFGTTLNVSLRWLRPRPLLAAALGGVLGPVAYAAGAAWGALDLVDWRAALLAQALGWGLLLPLTVALAARCDGFAALEPRHV